MCACIVTPISVHVLSVFFLTVISGVFPVTFLSVCIIIIILVITSMQSMYNYTPKTNRVTTVYSVAAVLYLQSVLRVLLFCMLNMFCTFYISTSRSLCAVPSMACFLQFLIFLLSQHAAQLLFEWFWDGSSRPYYYWYHFCFSTSTCAEFLLCLCIIIIIIIIIICMDISMLFATIILPNASVKYQ